jgi:hypothetical protein
MRISYSNADSIAVEQEVGLFRRAFCSEESTADLMTSNHSTAS